MTGPSDTAVWLPAVFFTHPRENRVTLIVLHWMATTLAGADATFTGGQRQASAHYGIEGTTVHQYVREGDAAWHAANRAVNHSSIGIEHSAQPGRDASPATVATSVALCTELCRTYGLAASAIHQHNEYTATQCPGTLPVAAIRAAVAANLGGTPPPATGFLMALTDAQQQELYDTIRELVNIARTGRRDGDVKVWPFPFTPADATLGQAQRNDQHAQVRADALTATMAKLAGSKDLTLEQVKAALAQVVAESVTVTGTLDIGPAASTP